MWAGLMQLVIGTGGWSMGWIYVVDGGVWAGCMWLIGTGGWSVGWSVGWRYVVGDRD